jgi:hypothetical protein
MAPGIRENYEFGISYRFSRKSSTICEQLNPFDNKSGNEKDSLNI